MHEPGLTKSALAQRRLAEVDSKLASLQEAHSSTDAQARHVPVQALLRRSALTLGVLQLVAAERDREVKAEALSKAQARNKEVTYMLAWLERKYDKLSGDHLTVQEDRDSARFEAQQARAQAVELKAELAQTRAKRRVAGRTR